MVKSSTIWRTETGQGDVGSIDTTYLITQASDFLTTQSGDFLILNPGSVTPKDDTVWSLSDTKASSIWRVDGFGDVGSTTAEDRLTVSGETRVTVLGDTRITEVGTYTPKDDTVWTDA